MGSHDLGKNCLLVELNVIKCLQRQREVPQQAVYSEESDDTEVAQHPVQRPGTILSRNGAATLY